MERVCKDLSLGIITLDVAMVLMNLQVERMALDLVADDAAKAKMNGSK
jgi:hypothetical protein